MINDNIPRHLRTRKQLREFGRDKPFAVRMLVQTTCMQMCTYARTKDERAKEIIRETIEQNLQRIAAM